MAPGKVVRLSDGVELSLRDRRQVALDSLARCERQWRAGDRTAPARAIRECAHGQLPPPWWVVEAFGELTVVAMSEDEKRARLEWHKHRIRWEALAELRERKLELLARGDDRGMTWDRAREAVSEMLAGGVAEGSDDTVKYSYDLVEEAGGAAATFQTYQAAVKRRRIKGPG